MSDVRVPHELGREGARRRLDALVARHGIALQATGEYRGTLEKALPLVGVARAEFEIEETVLVVRIVQAPAFPSLETIRRKVAEELGRILG